MGKQRHIALLALAALLASGAHAGIIYGNGAPLGQSGDEPFENYEVTDSFTLSATSTISAFEFVGWTDPGNIVQNIEWGISSTPDFAYDGTAEVGASALIAGLPRSSDYDIRSYTVAISPVTLGAGTYWLTLGHAQTLNGRLVYWDVNNGPSSAYLAAPVFDNYVGARQSNSFEILGTVSAPEPRSWGLMLVGFGLVGSVMRRRSQLAARPSWR